MQVICLDTNVLIWGVRQDTSNPKQKHMVAHARNFLEYCQTQNIQMLVPSVVVGEFLTMVEAQHHADVIKHLASIYNIADYDAHSAAKFAEILRDKKQKNIKEHTNITRTELKADIMILATAITMNADTIYTHDKGLRALSKGYIKSADIPKTQQQMELEIKL